MAFWGARLIAPASLIVLIAGVAMVLYSPAHAFSDTWIWLGLVGYGLTFVTGAFVIGPTSRKLGGMMAAQPADDREVTELRRRLVLIARIDLTVIVAIVADMVFKPGL